MTELRRLWVLPAAALLLAGCSDEGPVAPGGAGAGESVEYLTCEVDLRGGGVSCSGSEAGLEGGALGAIIGGQGVYVELASSNVSYDPGTEVFSSDVTVKNLGNQIIGTTDGVTPHADGIRLFFVDPPVVNEGSGTVSVRNADGLGSFSGSDQAYHQYSQFLAPGRTSLSKTWEWEVPATVDRFSFMVGVAAEVADESGFAPGGIDFISETVTADSLHTCAIDYSGQAWCWGAGGAGRLGNAASDDQLLPVKVEQGLTRFVSIAAALSTTCALDDTGAAWCWGNGGSGRLGNGGTSSSNVPVKVVGDHKFRQLARGRQFMCALDVEGKVYCWGYNGNGQFGDSTIDRSSEPFLGGGGKTYTHVAAGGYHTCGISADDGLTYCWGSSTRGKLGGGSDSLGNVYMPSKIVGDHKFTRVYGARQHTCALTAEGEAWCWGLNGNGQVGNGETTNSLVPVKVNTTERFASLSLGSYHTCGVTLDGRGFCWGSNARGKSGMGYTGGANVVTPEPVVDVGRFAAIAAGNDHTCGQTVDGKLYCWGTAGSGRLGTGSTTNTGTPQLVEEMGPIAWLMDAPESCMAGPEGDACFQRRTFDHHILLASARGEGYTIFDLG